MIVVAILLIVVSVCAYLGYLATTHKVRSPAELRAEIRAENLRALHRGLFR